MSSRTRKRKNRRKRQKQLLQKQEIDDSCVICLERLNKKFSLDCGHEFHKQCIINWFETLKNKEKQQKCPLCRKIYDKEIPIIDPPRRFPIIIPILLILAFLCHVVFNKS